MCGLAGVVDLRGHGPEGDAELALKPMVETLACRGPDAQTSWIDGPAALGHTRLAVVDLEGGRQPVVHEHDGRPVAALVFTGEIYNHHALRRELAAEGFAFATRSDSEVVLKAYLAWGLDAVTRLEGMFAFAIWDVRLRRLLLARDRLGVKPLYFRHTRDVVAFGSEPKAVLAHPGSRTELDLNGLRELLLSSHPMVNTPGRAVFKGMAEVPPAHTVTLDEHGVRSRRYWALTPREHTDDLPTTIATVRSLLTASVQGHLQADVPLCTLLSGGLDSSVIAAIAGGGNTTSVDFGASQESTDDAMRREWDAPYVDLMAAHLGSRHRRVVIPPADLADPALRAAVVEARDGLGMGDFDSSLLLLLRAVRQEHVVALSGEAADELFGGYRWFRDGADSATDFPWNQVVGPDLTRLLDPGLAAALDLRAHRADLYRQAVAELDHLPGTSARERELRTGSYLNLTRFLPALLERTDRLSMSCGLEVRVPFCDHRLVEYVFNTPWPLKTFDGREKSLLRAAAGGLVPEQILRRRKSPYPMVRDAAYRRALTGQVEALLLGDSPALALLDVRALRALLLRPEVADRFPRAGLEFVLDLDHWMRAHRPRLSL
ncbi:asparagine synthase (glutamine-hydrolyzing) [Nonomuraea sp. NPDC050556]|uniref:asparagine synthase (glutamine-hydrolyzing) n=1 Tax=Nonomuraea sp. NPDC050556 TaxID=3364369 RepID=UPI0037911494